MGRFIEGCDRRQKLLLPDCVDDFVSENSDLDQAEPARMLVGESRFIAVGGIYDQCASREDPTGQGCTAGDRE